MSELSETALAMLPRDTLVAMLKFFGRDVLTIDGLWFRGVEERFGLEKALEIDCEVWERFGTTEARRIKRELNITESGIPALVKALQFQSVVLASNMAFEIPQFTEDKVIFNITECGPQRARIREGVGEFPCKAVGMVYWGEFAKVINPRLKLKCLVCPPDEHPDNLWCGWEFKLE
jgi:hypothetical protein